MIARRIDRDRQIFEEHVTHPRPFRYANTAQALADVAVTSMMRYQALASDQVVRLHWGMATFSDEGAPWCILRPNDSSVVERPIHTRADCDKAIRADRRYHPNHCDWLPRFECACGRVWLHVCDEAEGCFYEQEDEPSHWECPSCYALVDVKCSPRCPYCDRKRPAGPEG